MSDIQVAISRLQALESRLEEVIAIVRQRVIPPKAWVDTEIVCAMCGKEWITWSTLDTHLPIQCPGCCAMAGHLRFPELP